MLPSDSSELAYSSESSNSTSVCPSDHNEVNDVVRGNLNEMMELERKATTSTEESQRISEIQDSDQECTTTLRRLLRQLKNYLFSHNGKELIMCAIVGMSLLGLSYLLGGNPMERPIPYQFINETGTYVLNLNYNEFPRGDMIPDWIVAVLACIICPGVQILISLTMSLCNNNKVDNPWRGDVHRSICVYLLTLAVNDFMTWALKSYMGILRPDFYSGCQPNETYDYCTNTDGEKGEFEFGGSFPSGHASYTFCSLTVLSLYLERTFGVSSVKQLVTLDKATRHDDGEAPTIQIVGLKCNCRSNRPMMVYRLISMLCSVPLVIGSFMTASRVVDNRHHPADILAGLLLGSYIGYFFHSLW
jgi:membrane-associated phospholipid phosphatase